MAEFKEVELVDAFLYLYICWGWINIFLSLIFLWIVFKNLQTASKAVNPSQYKLRSKYTISLILTLIASLVYALVVVFGINNTIIPWNYHNLPHIYQQILVFLLAFSGLSFMCCMLISFLIRVSILYQLNKLQSIILNSITILIMFFIVIMAVIITSKGVYLGHFQDKSTGIAIIRAMEKSVIIVYIYILIPLYIMGFILFSFIYSYKMKSLKTLSNKQDRDWLMPVVLKESILVLTACSILIIFGLCIILIPNENLLLFTPMKYGLMLICSFLDFNHKIYYKLCYYPSLCWLNICCFHAKKENDAQVLLVQSNHDYNVIEQQESDAEHENDILQNDL